MNSIQLYMASCFSIITSVLDHVTTLWVNISVLLTSIINFACQSMHIWPTCTLITTLEPTPNLCGRVCAGTPVPTPLTTVAHHIPRDRSTLVKQLANITTRVWQREITVFLHMFSIVPLEQATRGTCILP